MKKLGDKLENAMIGMSIRTQRAFEKFKESEAGDTNFISMLLVIGIVVVLATAFKGLADETMKTISQNVKNFVSGLGG